MKKKVSPEPIYWCSHCGWETKYPTFVFGRARIRRDHEDPFLCVEHLADVVQELSWQVSAKED